LEVDDESIVDGVVRIPQAGGVEKGIMTREPEEQ
jgi:hypothetical protein